MIQIGEPEVIDHGGGRKTITTKYELSTDRAYWDAVIEWRRLMDYEYNMIYTRYGTLSGKSHKPKDKTMWIKSEDFGCLINLREASSVIVHLSEGKHCVMTAMGYGHKTIKSFKYKEDAEKYLDELMDKLNDED